MKVAGRVGVLGLAFSAVAIALGAGVVAATECTEAITFVVNDCAGYLELQDNDVCEALWKEPIDGTELPKAQQPVEAGADCSENAFADLFHIYVLPDTQHYAQYFDGTGSGDAVCAPLMYCQAQGVASEWSSSDELVFVTHVGDLIQNENPKPLPGDPQEIVIQKDQWQFAIETYAQFFDVGGVDGEHVPHSIAIGNHDFDDFNDLPLTESTCFEDYFGPTRYEVEDTGWFADVPPPSDFGASSANMAQLFTGFEPDANGDRGDPIEFLHLNLEYETSDAALAWAKAALEEYASMPTMITTHAYSASSGVRFRGSKDTGQPKGSDLSDMGENQGEEIYQKLVYLYPQIFMVVGGHVDGNGIERADNFLTDVMGNAPGDQQHFEVIEHLADYQGLTQEYQSHCIEGGLMHKLRFRADEIEFDTVAFRGDWNVVPGEGPGDGTGCSRCAPIDLTQWRQDLQQEERRIFRFPQPNGAGQLRTTYIDEDLPLEAFGDEPDVLINSLGEGGQQQGLLAFDNMFGNHAGQIPVGMEIEKAVLTLTFEGGDPVPASGASTLCDAEVYRMNRPWTEALTWSETESAVWNGLGEGIAVPNREGEPTVVIPGCKLGGLCAGYVFDPDNPDFTERDWRGTRSFDVTGDVQFWYEQFEANSSQQGDGWVLLIPTETDQHHHTEGPNDLHFYASFRSANWTSSRGPDGSELPQLTISVKPSAP